MKVLVKSLNDTTLEKQNYEDTLVIEVNGKQEFKVADGSVEDNNLSRNFSDCYKIQDLMNQAYKAGVKGEALYLLSQRLDEV